MACGAIRIGVAAEGTFQLIFYVIFEMVFIGTGDAMLYILTLGKRKPVWKREYIGSAIRLAIPIDASFIIGFIFWLAHAWLLVR